MAASGKIDFPPQPLPLLSPPPFFLMEVDKRPRASEVEVTGDTKKQQLGMG